MNAIADARTQAASTICRRRTGISRPSSRGQGCAAMIPRLQGSSARGCATSLNSLFDTTMQRPARPGFPANARYVRLAIATGAPYGTAFVSALNQLRQCGTMFVLIEGQRHFPDIVPPGTALIYYGRTEQRPIGQTCARQNRPLGPNCLNFSGGTTHHQPGCTSLCNRPQGRRAGLRLGIANINSDKKKEQVRKAAFRAVAGPTYGAPSSRSRVHG